MQLVYNTIYRSEGMSMPIIVEIQSPSGFLPPAPPSPRRLPHPLQMTPPFAPVYLNLPPHPGTIHEAALRQGAVRQNPGSNRRCWSECLWMWFAILTIWFTGRLGPPSGRPSRRPTIDLNRSPSLGSSQSGDSSTSP